MRAVGLKVKNLLEIEERFKKEGIEPVLIVDRGDYRETQYQIAGILFTLAEYPEPPIGRVTATLMAGISQLEDTGDASRQRDAASEASRSERR